jgi:phosphatidylserine/phosphatidylglycerophosphate/cardiolipin synthase-like enzyme
VVQSAGHAYRLRAPTLRGELQPSGAVLALLLQYTQALMAHMAQTARCTRFHTIDQQLSKRLLLVDSRLAFTGGVGIAPHWTGQAKYTMHWRDTRFQVEGPVVAQTQAVFIDNWIKVTGHLLHGPSYFAPLASTGGMRAQIFSSSPSGGSESMTQGADRHSRREGVEGALQGHARPGR